MAQKDNFKSQYLHAKWQKRRLEIMQRDGFKCCGCNNDVGPLHVHHHYYVSGRKVWEYPDSALLTVCENCHAILTENGRADKFYEQPYKRIAHISSLVLKCKEADTLGYSRLFCEALRETGFLKLKDNLRIIEDEYGFSGFDIIEQALYSVIPFSDFQTYVEECVAQGQIISYEEIIAARVSDG